MHIEQSFLHCSFRVLLTEDYTKVNVKEMSHCGFNLYSFIFASLYKFIANKFRGRPIVHCQIRKPNHHEVGSSLARKFGPLIKFNFRYTFAFQM